MKVGTKILGYFIGFMEKAGYIEFHLDCLLHNLRAKNLYHSFGFKEVKEIVGFDGTDHSKVEVVSMIKIKMFKHFSHMKLLLMIYNSRNIQNIPLYLKKT